MIVETDVKAAILIGIPIVFLVYNYYVAVFAVIVVLLLFLSSSWSTSPRALLTENPPTMEPHDS
jgi:hypothetical protein